MALLKSSLLEEMSEIRQPMAASRCFIIVGGWLELVSMYRVSLLGFLYGYWVPSVEEVADLLVFAYRNVQSLFLKISCDVLSSPFRLWSACVS